MKEKTADKKIYFKCPKCKKIIERSKDNPFIKWKFLHLFCESFCEKHGGKVLMRRCFKVKEKTADEMFEELGYKKYITDKYQGYYQYGRQSNTICILFILDKKAIAIRYDGSNTPAITMNELQAINKKVEELGWLD